MKVPINRPEEILVYRFFAGESHRWSSGFYRDVQRWALIQND